MSRQSSEWVWSFSGRGSVILADGGNPIFIGWYHTSWTVEHGKQILYIQGSAQHIKKTGN